MSLFFVVLFFYCYLDHRDLHSFPTRRFPILLLQSLSQLPERLPVRQLAPGVYVIVGDTGRGSEGDRKSTRLNSSHANISYAVFCLKKKKDTNTTSNNTSVSLIHYAGHPQYLS